MRPCWICCFSAALLLVIWVRVWPVDSVILLPAGYPSGKGRGQTDRSARPSGRPDLQTARDCLSACGRHCPDPCGKPAGLCEMSPPRHRTVNRPRPLLPALCAGRDRRRKGRTSGSDRRQSNMKTAPPFALNERGRFFCQAGDFDKDGRR